MEQAIEQFERYIKSRYPNSTTAKHYRHDLRQFSRLVGKPSRAVTRADVDRFVEDQLARGLAATTVNRRLARDYERAQARLTPALSLTDESFNASTQTAEPQPRDGEGNCV